MQNKCAQVKISISFRVQAKAYNIRIKRVIWGDERKMSNRNSVENQFQFYHYEA